MFGLNRLKSFWKHLIYSCTFSLIFISAALLSFSILFLQPLYPQLSFCDLLSPQSFRFSPLITYLSSTSYSSRSFQGLETSKPGQYHSLPSENILELSDSGGEFVTSSLPVDSDTDAAMTYASHRPLLNAISPTAVTEACHYGILDASQPSDSALSASPTSNQQSVPAVTLITVTAAPESVSKDSTGSDLGKVVENAEQKGELAQSTWNNCILILIFTIRLFPGTTPNHYFQISPLDVDGTLA